MKKLGLALLFILLVRTTQAQYSLVQEIVSNIKSDSLITTVKQLSGLLPIENQTVLNSRYRGTVGNTLTSNFIQRKLTEWGIPFDTFNFGGTGTNIIAKIDGRRTDKILVMGAHYDAVGGNNLEFFYPGADDNASGTAAILEAARLCANHQFPVTLHFAFWDEEEQGLLGSKAQVNDYVSGNRLIGYINLDMIAWSKLNDSIVEINTKPSGYSVEMANKVSTLTSLYGIPLKPVLMNPGDPNTDHGTFWLNNLTAIGINEIYNGPNMNPHWHMLTDSFTYFNIPYFVNMSKYATTALLHLAMDSAQLVGLPENNPNAPVLYVYPVPFEHEFYLDLPAGTLIERATLLNTLGEEISITCSEHRKVTLTQDISKGIYWLNLLVRTPSTGSTYLRKKIIVN